MAGSSLGDIVVSLGIDSRKWYEEAIALQNSAKGLGDGIQRGLGGRGALGAGIISGIGDALSSAAGGGGLGSAASSIVGTLTGAISKAGPWGIAIGTGAGILADQLLPKLFDSKTAMDSFSRSIDTNITALDRHIKKSSEAIDFADRLGKLGASGSGKDVDTALAEKDLTRSKLVAERDATARAFADSVFAAVKAGAVKNLDPAGRGIFDARSLVRDDAILSIDKSILGDEGAKLLVDLRERLVRSGSAIDAIDRDRAALSGIRPGALERDEFEERRRRSGEAERVRLSLPGAAAIKSAQDIASLVGDSFLEKGAGATAIRGVIDNFEKMNAVTAPNQQNVAAIGGTAAGFSALQDSIKESRSDSKALSDSARETVNVLKQILAKVGTATATPVGIN